jgi:hypothetical protein
MYPLAGVQTSLTPEGLLAVITVLSGAHENVSRNILDKDNL